MTIFKIINILQVKNNKILSGKINLKKFKTFKIHVFMCQKYFFCSNFLFHEIKQQYWYILYLSPLHILSPVNTLSGN